MLIVVVLLRFIMVINVPIGCQPGPYLLLMRFLAASIKAIVNIVRLSYMEKII